MLSVEFMSILQRFEVLTSFGLLAVCRFNGAVAQVGESA